MPAAYPNLARAAGTTIAISKLAPATHDKAGFDALVDATTPGDATTGFVEIGLVTNMGSIPKPVRGYKDVTTFNGITYKVPGSENMENSELSAVLDITGKGQEAVESVSDGTTICWYRWTMPNGRKKYIAAYTTGVGDNLTGPDDEITTSWTIVPLFDVNGVGTVTSDPA